MTAMWKWTPRLVKYLRDVYGTKPPTIPTGYTFRRPVLDDFEQVKKLTGSVHQETDSFPARYEAYLKDPRRFMVVAQDNNTTNLVAFNMCIVTDGGNAFAGLVARADPSVRSQGVFHALRAYGEQIILEQLPKANCLRAAPLNMHLWKEKIAKQEVNTTIPTTKNFLKILGPTSVKDACSVYVEPQRPCDSYFTEASMTDLASLMSNEDNVKHLFPGNVVFNFGGPCGAYAVNADLLLEEDKVCTMERVQQGGDITSVALTRVNHCQLGLALTLDYYGPSEKTRLLGHAFFIINKLKDLYVRGKVQMAFVLPQSADVDALAQELDAHGFSCDTNSKEKYYITESVWSNKTSNL